MFKLNNNMKTNAAKIFSELIIIVTADEKAMLVDMTLKDKLLSINGVLDIEDLGVIAREISIAEALELWKD